MRVVLILLSALLVAACSKPEKEAAAAPKKPSTMKTAVDGFTGKTAVESGQRAKAQLEAIRKKENAEMDEILK